MSSMVANTVTGITAVSVMGAWGVSMVSAPICTGLNAVLRPDLINCGLFLLTLATPIAIAQRLNSLLHSPGEKPGYGYPAIVVAFAKTCASFMLISLLSLLYNHIRYDAAPNKFLLTPFIGSLAVIAGAPLYGRLYEAIDQATSRLGR